MINISLPFYVTWKIIYMKVVFILQKEHLSPQIIAQYILDSSTIKITIKINIT